MAQNEMEHGLKRAREEEFPPCDNPGEVDDGSAPSSKRQCEGICAPVSSLEGCNMAADESTSSFESLSGVTEEQALAGANSILKGLEQSLAGDEPAGSDCSALSKEDAARVLRSLEEELGVSESGDYASISNVPSSAEEALAGAVFTSWGEEIWSTHGFSSADLSVGCSSGSSLTGDGSTLGDRYHDELSTLVDDNTADGSHVDIGYLLEASDDELGIAPSPSSERGGAEFSKENWSYDDTTLPCPTAAPSEALDNLHETVSWALEEGRGDYAGFSDISAGEEWMMPVGNLDFLLDSSAAYPTIAPLVEAGMAL